MLDKETSDAISEWMETATRDETIQLIYDLSTLAEWCNGVDQSNLNFLVNAGQISGLERNAIARARDIANELGFEIGLTQRSLT